MATAVVVADGALRAVTGCEVRPEEEANGQQSAEPVGSVRNLGDKNQGIIGVHHHSIVRYKKSARSQPLIDIRGGVSFLCVDSGCSSHGILMQEFLLHLRVLGGGCIESYRLREKGY